MAAHGTLLYLHGFNSSPQSAKAGQLRCYLAQHALQIDYLVPTLPFEPFAAIQAIENAIKSVNATQIGIVGSSLGGFYATYIAEKWAEVKAALINPAVRPYSLLENYLGEQVNPYTGERYVLDSTHIAQLKALDVEPIQCPHNFLLLAQTGDEVLDFRQAEQKYAECQQMIESGGSHAFEQFEQHIPTMLKFFGFVE